jgi:hypothetical protein
VTGLELLQAIAKELGTFTDRLVFTGGLVLPLYLTQRPRLRFRPTRDADVVVACSSHRAWLALQDELKTIGVRPFAEAPDAPICRMRLERFDEIVQGTLREPEDEVLERLWQIARGC